MKNKIKLETCKFVCGTAIIPEKWCDWFWGLFSGDCDFSWGDNNRTFITAARFLDRCKECGLEDEVPQKEVDKFMEMLKDLGQTYIDLEN